MLSDLSILAVLIASGEALNRKNYRGTDFAEFGKSGPNYHPAPNVMPGECTKKLKPQLFFIGQPYSGSTSLSDLMTLHPELSWGTTKEHQHFYKPVSEVNSKEATAQYVEEFWVHCNTTVTFDASMNQYIMGLTPWEYEETDGQVLTERIKNFRAQMGWNVKIMMMFRDPVDLFFSAECNRRQGDLLAQYMADYMIESPWFDANNPPNVSSREWARPAAMLQRWFEIFPNKNNYAFFSSDDFFASPQETLDEIFRFVGVAPRKLDADALKENSGRRRCNLKATPAERRAYWSVEDNMQHKISLETMTGLQFSWDKKDM